MSEKTEIGKKIDKLPNNPLERKGAEGLLPDGAGDKAAIARSIGINSQAVLSQEQVPAGSLDRVLSEAKDLFLALQDLKGSGTKLEFQAAIVGNDTELNSQIAAAAHKFETYVFRSGLESVHQQAGEQLFVDPRLRRAGLLKVNIPQFHIEYDKKLGLVAIWSILKPDAPLMVENFDPKDKSQIDRLARSLQEEYLRSGNQARQFFRGLPAKKTGDYLVQVGEPLRDSCDLPSYFQSVSFKLFHMRSKEDRYHAYVSPQIDSLRNNSLTINLPIQSIVLEKQATIISLDQDGQGKIKRLNGKELTSTFKDQFGNVVVSLLIAPTGAKIGDQISEKALIYPPLLFSRDEKSSQHPLSLDLTTLGLGKYEKFLTQPSVPSVAVIGNAHLNGFLEDRELEMAVSKSEAIKGGLTATNKLLSLNDGELIKNVRIASTYDDNAYFRIPDPNCIVLQLPLLVSEDPKYAILHEGVHLLDNHLDFSLSGGRFKDLYEKIKKSPAGMRFLNAIDEQTFMADLGLGGGHSHENEKEFLSSFVVSLTAPDWERRFSALSQDSKAEYQASLLALREQLRAEETLNKSKLLELVETRIEESRKFI